MEVKILLKELVNSGLSDEELRYRLAGIAEKMLPRHGFGCIMATIGKTKAEGETESCTMFSLLSLSGLSRD